MQVYLMTLKYLLNNIDKFLMGKNKNPKNSNQNLTISQNENIQNENIQNENIQNENIQNENIQNENIQDENIQDTQETTIPDDNSNGKILIDTSEYLILKDRADEFEKKYLELVELDKENVLKDDKITELTHQLANTLDELSGLKEKNEEIKKMYEIKNLENTNEKAKIDLLKVELEDCKNELEQVKEELFNTQNELELTKNKIHSSNTMELLFKLKNTIENQSNQLKNIPVNTYDVNFSDNPDNLDNQDTPDISEIKEFATNINNLNKESKIIVETEEAEDKNRLNEEELIKQNLLIKQRRKNRKF